MTTSKIHLKLLKDLKDLCVTLNITPLNLYVKGNCIYGFNKNSNNEEIFYAASDLDSDDVYMVYDLMLKYFSFKKSNNFINSNKKSIPVFIPAYIDSNYNIELDNLYISNLITKIIPKISDMNKVIEPINFSKDLNILLDKKGNSKVIVLVSFNLIFDNDCLSFIKVENEFGGPRNE
ncbi:TPA: hypothetical protein I9080_002161 [Clostridium perfringens]|uniref:Uncharacterized protein n=1 Tax=Clostridium perfringens TaxID=1502 RepID=A0A8H9QY42_CLOPF|nr:hypothetical protein [Clostridium perfringens]